MTWEELKERLIIEENVFSLKQGTLTPDVDTWVQKYFGTDGLKVTNASKVEESDKVIISGNTCTFNLENVGSETTFTLDAEGNVGILLRIMLDPQSWSFYQSFPDIIGGEGNPVSEISYSECYLLLSNKMVENYDGFCLREGINFYGVISSSPLMTMLERQCSVYPIMCGYINLDDPGELTPLPWGTYPFEKDSPENPVPGFVFSVELKDYSDFSIGKIVSFKDTGLRIYCPLSAAFAKRNPTYCAAQAFYTWMTVPSVNIDMRCYVNYIPACTGFEVNLLFDNLNLGNLLSLGDLMPGEDAEGSLPELLRKSQLTDLSITQFGLDFSVEDGKLCVDGVLVTVGMPNAVWSVLDDKLQIGKISSTFTYIPARDEEKSPLGVRISGEVTIKGHRVGVRAVKDNDFTLYLDLLDKVDIPLDEFVAEIYPDLPKPSKLSINTVSSEISPSSQVSILATMASGKDAWVIPVGKTKLTLSDIVLYFQYKFKEKESNADDGLSGYYSGTIDFDEKLQLTASYAFPSKKFAVRMFLPNFSLVEFINKFCKEKVTLPNDFDIKLTNSIVVFEKGSGESYQLKMATIVNDFGFLMFELKKSGSETGFIFGMNIDGKSMWELPGLSKLAFFEAFKLNKLALVVSTMKDRDYTFPAGKEFNVPAFESCTVHIPGTSGIVKGFNFMAEWEIHTGKPDQKIFAKFFDIDSVMAIVLQVGEDETRMYASNKLTICGQKFEVEAGAQLKNESVGLYAKGKIPLKIRNTEQEFALEVGFNNFGVYGAGTMKGEKPIDFGFFQLGNAALLIGADAEGIPSVGIAATIAVDELFHSSVAILFDSSVPQNSMAAGSLSDLSLADVYDVFLKPDSVSKQIAEQRLYDIRDILEMFSIKGTALFDLPSDMIRHFDDYNYAEIVSAFAEHNVDLPEKASQVFYVIGSKGNKWYLTDLTKKSMQYQIVKETDEQTQTSVLKVSKEAQFYAAAQNTRIGELEYDAGFRVNGLVNVYHFTFDVDINIVSATDFIVSGKSSPIELAGGLIKITSADATEEPSPFDGGPALTITTSGDPFAYVDAKIQILDIITQMYKITAGKEGFDAEWDYDGPAAAFRIAARLEGKDCFAAVLAGTLKQMVISIISSIGKYFGEFNLETGVNGSVCLRVVDMNEVYFTANLSVDFLGTHHELATITLDTEIKTVKELAEALIKGVGVYLAELVTDSVEYAVLYLKKLIDYKGKEVLDALIEVFALSLKEATEILEKAQERLEDSCAIKKAAETL
ncbi:MAG: hypothetical protein IKX54_02490 [Lachnospiraceae bacterium]|nr:hypothetical protein [Lachnospiraceae bacterium]